MPYTRIHDLDHYTEQAGEGVPIVFVHGAFVDSGMWDLQWNEFSKKYRVIRYDLRGHGKTGSSERKQYSMGLFADDLKELMDSLELDAPIICGLSLGGMIAQDFAVRFPDRLRALVLADTAVSVSLTLADKLQRYVLFPKWVMRLTLKLMSVEGFTRFSFWLASVTRSEEWFGRDPRTRDYVRGQMLTMDRDEYLKIYDAIYAFHLRPLERITCPTLVLNGEYESPSVFRHTEEILRRVPRAESEVVPQAGHTSNMENPEAFNRLMAEFLDLNESGT